MRPLFPASIALLRPARVLVAIVGVGSAAQAVAAATDIRCPATLVQAPISQGVPPDWVLRGAPAELPLQRAAFYNGDPGALGSLAPDSTHRNGTTETSTWLFAGAEAAPVWIACLYRDGTSVVAKPLPPGVHRCTTRTRVTAMGDPSGLLSVTCN